MNHKQECVYNSTEISMRKIAVVVLGVFMVGYLASGCNKKEEKKPAEILSRESMVAVLADIELVEANILLRNLGYTDSTKKQAYGYYKFVLLKHHLTPEGFQKSFKYYTDRPEEMSKMYTDVLTVISQKQALAQEKQKEKLKKLQNK